MKRITIVSVALLFAVFLISCATTGPEGRQSLVLISTPQEISIGQGMDQQLRETETILPDSVWQDYINNIGQRIVAVSDRSDLQFRFTVIESDQVNAFAAPGGFVYFYTGLLREMDTESQLAAVMAHEISHVVARHSIRRLQSIMGASIVLDLALGGSSDNAKALASTALGIVMSGYSRSQEAEADNFGTSYMMKAGWDPNGMVSMFGKLEELSGHQEMGFFEMLAASHPATEDRITATKEEIAGFGVLPRNMTIDSPRFQDLKTRLPKKKEGS